MCIPRRSGISANFGRDRSPPALVRAGTRIARRPSSLSAAASHRRSLFTAVFERFVRFRAAVELDACRGLLPDACRDFDEGSDYDDQSGRLHPEVIGKTTLVSSLRIGRRHHGDHE